MIVSARVAETGDNHIPLGRDRESLARTASGVKVIFGKGAFDQSKGAFTQVPAPGGISPWIGQPRAGC